ncbi:DM9 repeat-containing protein [Bowmanella dokdonensis]|uniref:DUF3421 domain-containing protein n=1 Tax=Bowmanella dokdonensis TaxID=751969 RepID=A0A939IPQ5_9ALTE|nr:DM9 repeat-containing protein [Bowmanella dokdonensis]MBN7827683.1 DUF3421 domain-containing protein [Bowmanella dokdonensis]
MNKLAKVTSILSMSFVTTLHAASFGSYDLVSKSDFPSDGYIPPEYVSFQGTERTIGKTIGICTDTHSRRVPGKIVDGSCFVEWDGKEYKNDEFFILRSSSGYRWTSVNQENKNFILNAGVTPGTTDEGNYVYHCRIWDPQNNIYTAGKYIPSRNGCYFALYGANFRSEKHAFLEVLTVGSPSQY